MTDMRVEYVTHSGSDLLVTNAARASFGKESEWDVVELEGEDENGKFTEYVQELSERDRKLIWYLAREGHCYDDKTEVFTDRGWLLWKDALELEARLAAVCPSGLMRYEVPSSVVQQDYEGPMLLTKQQHVNMCVTPNHRMWVSCRHKDGFSKFHIVEAKDIAGKQYRVSTGALSVDGSKGTYEEGMYLGMFLGDGHRASVNRVVFRFKKSRKIKELADLLVSLGVPHSVRVTDAGVTEFRVENSDPHFSGTSENKSIPEEVFTEHSASYRKGLYEGLLATDGHRKRSSWTFCTTSAELAEGFLRLATTLGEYCKYNADSSSGAKQLVVMSRSESPRLNDAGVANDEWVAYRGKIYCATVSTGLLLVRRGGCIVVSGNSLPFRHPQITLRIKAPIFVCRQIGEHQTGLSWSEESRRYIDSTPEFYWSDKWRRKAENVKQGSSEQEVESMCTSADGYVTTPQDLASAALRHAVFAYEELLHGGVAPEQARMVLPQNMMTTFVWTGSLLGYIQMLQLRLDAHSQKEIRDLAQMIAEVIKPLFPVSYAALMGEDDGT